MIWTPSTLTTLQDQWDGIVRMRARIQAKAEGLIAKAAYQIGNLMDSAGTILPRIDWRGLRGDGKRQRALAHAGPLFIEAFDLRTINQTSEGWELLNATLVEHERLLWELEYLAKDMQPDRNSDISNKLDLVRAQILLFERLLIGQRVDSLAVLVNHYAEIVSKPDMEIATT